MPTEKGSKIINVADDFGISKLANRNILKLVKKDKVDRVSVLIYKNQNNLKEKDVQQLKASKVKIDLHLDLQLFLRMKERKLKEGALGRLLGFGLGYLFGKGRASKVEAEWEAQIKQFEKIFSKAPDGLNSHQYIHLFPKYFKIVLKLAKKYNIPYVRYGKAGMIKSRHSVYRILNPLHRLTKEDFHKSNCRSSDFLVSLDWIKNVSNFLGSLPKGTTEIVCHPERDEEFKQVMRYF